jgi:hypothetical protein
MFVVDEPGSPSTVMCVMFPSFQENAHFQTSSPSGSQLCPDASSFGCMSHPGRAVRNLLGPSPLVSTGPLGSSKQLQA